MGNCTVRQKLWWLKKMKLFLFFKTSTGKLCFSFKIFSNVRTYRYIWMNIKLWVKEYNIDKYGVIGIWIDDNLYNFCFKNIEQCHQVPRNSSIGVTFPLTVYNFFWIGSIKYFRPLGYTTKNVEFIYLHVIHDGLLLSTKRFFYLFQYNNNNYIYHLQSHPSHK